MLTSGRDVADDASTARTASSMAGVGQRRKTRPARDRPPARRPLSLELGARDISLHFGHQDGGELVRKLYGTRTLRRLARACVKPFGTHLPLTTPSIVGRARAYLSQS